MEGTTERPKRVRQLLTSPPQTVLHRLHVLVVELCSSFVDQSQDSFLNSGLLQNSAAALAAAAGSRAAAHVKKHAQVVSVP